MSFDMPDHPPSRNTALARLLAEALQSQTKPAGRPEISACPDAEVLAAYAEHGLAAEEKARWEDHFAGCGRCQKIIAVLAASGEALSPAEVERLGSLASAPSVARVPMAREAATPRTMLWRRPALWRWLVPAVGIASAAALWLALHPPPPPATLSSQKNVARTGVPQSETTRGAATASAKSDETQIAQAKLPAPPTEPPPEALLRDKETAPRNFAPARQEREKKQETLSNAPQAAPVSEADRLESRADTAKDGRVLSGHTAEPQADTNALTASAPAAPAAVPAVPTPARNGERTALQGLDSALGARGSAQLKALARTESQAIVFASPNRRAFWRLGSGGRIEYSSDQGQTWQPQTSGVTSDLVAGAAPSEKVAWVVGRAGAIVRTEDGEHWQRVVPPSAEQTVAPSIPALDWNTVEARDALRATITSRDSRRFVTEDGGRTWRQVQ